VRSYARTWTQEFKDRGIRINTLSPGPIDTPIMDGQADTKEGADAIRAAFASVIPLRANGPTEEVAAAAYFLASDDASFVAGIDLAVDAAWPRSRSIWKDFIMSNSVIGLSIDCADAATLAQFWADVLAGR